MSRIELSIVVKVQLTSSTFVWTLPYSLSSAALSRVATRTKDRDIPTPTSSGADLSCGGSSSRAAPLAIEGAGDTDTEACPVVTSVKNASGAPLSVHPTADTATCTDNGSSHATSAHDIEDLTGRAAPAMGTPDVSSTCSPMDAAIGYASLVDVVAAPTPLTLTTGAAPVSF